MFLEYFLFHPKKLPEDFTFDFPGNFTEFFLKTEEQTEINGLWFREENSRGLILYFHGNADNLIRWGKHAGDFRACGYDTMMIDYRGFGKSTGEPSEAAFHHDAERFYEYAIQHYSPENITIYGRSLGSAIATRLAAHVPSERLILETPFYNLPELLLHYLPWFGDKIPREYDFRSDIFIQQVTCPITIFHGTRDLVVPYSEGRKFVGLLGEKVKFHTIEGGGHKNLSDFPEYHQALGEALGMIQDKKK